jgi:leader peptidase (prepilin peptidase)/N-methyltransferase
VAGAAALSGSYLGVHLISPTGMGAGDVKLALGLGALTGALGAEIWVLAALTAPLVTAALGVAGAACGRRGPIPHGPSMLLASLLAAALAVL